MGIDTRPPIPYTGAMNTTKSTGLGHDFTYVLTTSGEEVIVWDTTPVTFSDAYGNAILATPADFDPGTISTIEDLTGKAFS